MTHTPATRQPFELRRGSATLVGDQWPGAGPTVVLLHSGVTDRRGWREVAPRLAGKAAVAAYDCRGFGDSAPSDEPFTHLDDLLAVLDEMANGPVWLVGNSMGGRIALDAAVTAPERVVGLVLIAAGVSGAPEVEFDPATKRLDALLDAADAAGDLDEVARLLTWVWLDGAGQPEGRVSGPARELALDMLRVILRNNASEEAEDSGVDAWSRLDEVAAPAFVACGDLDLPHLVRRSDELAQRLPRGQRRVLRGVAHLPYLEDPAAVGDLIAEAAGLD